MSYIAPNKTLNRDTKSVRSFPQAHQLQKWLFRSIIIHYQWVSRPLAQRYA